MIQAVILAGGLGTRLRSVSGGVPKPMVEVAGKPFLFHLTKMLIRNGFTDFLFLLGYRSEVAVEFLRRFSAEGVNIRWSVETEPMGTAGALKYAGGLAKPRGVLINGDSYLDMDYRGFVSAFEKSGRDAFLAVYDNTEDTNVLKNVAVSQDGEVVLYKKGVRDEHLTHVDAGVFAFTRGVMDLIPAGRPCSLEEEIYPALIKKKRIGAYPVNSRFYDIGTPERLREFEGVLKK